MLQQGGFWRHHPRPAKRAGLWRVLLMAALALGLPAAAKADWVMTAPACSPSSLGLSGPAYGYDGVDFTLPGTLLQGYGYWVQGGVAGEIEDKCPNPVLVPVTVAINPGFNLIGNPFDEPLGLSNLLGPGEEVFAYRNNQYVSLQTTDAILPHEGVWWYSPGSTVKTLFAVAGQSGDEFLNLVAVCGPLADPTDAQRLAPGGSVCRRAPQQAGECGFAGAFEMTSSAVFYVMGLRASTPISGPGCLPGSPVQVAAGSLDLSASPAIGLGAAPENSPAGLFPWSSAGASLKVGLSIASGSLILSASDSQGASSNSLILTLKPALTVNSAVPCPVTGTSFTATERAALAMACIQQAAAGGGLSQTVARNNKGQLALNVALAVALSDGAYDFVPTSQVMTSDFDPDTGMNVTPAGEYHFSVTAGHAGVLGLDLQGVGTAALTLVEETYTRIVTCPTTLLLQDPALSGYGPLSGSLPPLPPLNLLFASYQGGPIPVPPPGQTFELPQSSLDLCAAAAAPFSTSVRLGQPVSFFAVGLGGSGARLLNLDTATDWVTPRRLAISALPDMAGLAGVMPLESGDIRPVNVDAPVVWPLSLTVVRNEPAELWFTCLQGGAFPVEQACTEENGAVKLKRVGVITAHARYLSPSVNLWPDLPPFVGPLFISPSTDIGLNFGEPGGTNAEWPTGQVQALDLAPPTQTYELKTAVGDVLIPKNLLIESGAQGGVSGSVSIRYCARAVDPADAQAVAQAQVALTDINCPGVTTIAVTSAQVLMLSIVQDQGSGPGFVDITDPPGYNPLSNMLSATGSGFVAVYELQGGGSITMGLSQQLFTLTVNF